MSAARRMRPLSAQEREALACLCPDPAFAAGVERFAEALAATPASELATERKRAAAELATLRNALAGVAQRLERLSPAARRALNRDAFLAADLETLPAALANVEPALRTALAAVEQAGASLRPTQGRRRDHRAYKAAAFARLLCVAHGLPYTAHGGSKASRPSAAERIVQILLRYSEGRRVDRAILEVKETHKARTPRARLESLTTQKGAHPAQAPRLPRKSTRRRA